MNGKEIAQEIKQKRQPEHQFIRWWRAEHDWVNYELVDNFLEKASEDEEMDGYELVDIEAVWQALKERVGDRVRREKRTQGEQIVWQRPDRPDQTCPFNAESVMTVLDVETRGNVIEE